MSKQEEELARKRTWLERIYSPPADTASRPICSMADSAKPLPDFFVVGPPRTGTTWIHEILRSRTSLPSPTKETRFFDTHFQRGLAWYRAHFSTARPGLRVGEVAPTYFAATEAAERIAQLLPKARIVCIFRNPVERVLSLYKLKCAYGLIPWTFEQAMVRDPEMLESSRYATKLKIWQQALGRDQVLATFYDDLRCNPQLFLDTLVDFIGVPRFQLTNADTQGIHSSETMTHPRSYHRTRSASSIADWFKARRLDRVVAAVRNSPLRKLFLGGGRPFAELTVDNVLALYDLFRGEVEELENLLNRDLRAWKSLPGQRLTGKFLRSDEQSSEPLVFRRGTDAI